MFSHGVTVTVERPGDEDRFGNTLPGTSHEESGAGIAPGGSSEANADSATVEWDLDLIFHERVPDIRAHDQVVIPDDPTTYEVHGRPRVSRNPYTGWDAGTVIRLKGVTG